MDDKELISQATRRKIGCVQHDCEECTGRKWQPIETAPRDGTRVLLWRDGAGTENISEGRWQLDVFGLTHEWGGDGWSYPAGSGPTHWMTKPEAPNLNSPTPDVG